jgi:hypothetical protein
MRRSEKLTEEQLNRLKFIEGSGLMVRPGMHYNIHFVNEDTYNKLDKMFKAYADITSIPKDAKGFILPKNNLKKDDIKEICKRYDLKITNDISKADFFIGNDHVSTYVSMHSTSTDSRCLLTEGYGTHILTYDYMGLDIKNQFINFMSQRSSASADLLNEQTCVVYTKEINSRYEDWTAYSSERHLRYISDDGLFILYNMLSKRIPVISVDSLFKGIDKVTIDNDIYNTLKMMLRGSDEDKAVAMNMLYNCNVDQSYYYLWKLINKLSYAIIYYKHRNTKAHKTFMAAVGHLNHTDNIEALHKFKEKNCLTKEIYDQLSEKIINRVKGYGVIEEVERNNVLKVNIEIIPYEEYMQPKNENVDV